MPDGVGGESWWGQDGRSGGRDPAFGPGQLSQEWPIVAEVRVV